MTPRTRHRLLGVTALILLAAWSAMLVIAFSELVAS